MQKYIAAIDQGTTSSRCIIFDHKSGIVSSSQKEHQQIYPKPGWVEHDPLEILANCKETFSDALDEAGLVPNQIEAIGITNQRETTLVWDPSTGLPYHNAIVWQDTRTSELVSNYESSHGNEFFRSKTGLPLATYFSGLKLKWLLDNIPDLRQKANTNQLLFGTIDSWLIWQLTGGPDGGIHVSDVSNASRTQLMNIHEVQWDKDILSEFNIPENVLPKIVASSNLIGTYQYKNTNIPIAGILGDQQAALFGQTCFSSGEAKNTYGTGCFLLLNTGNVPVSSKNGLLTTLGYQIGAKPPVYCLEGSVAVTGALIQWLRDNLGIIRDSSEIEILASQVENNGGVYFVPAFSGLFAPYWQSSARGIIAGLTGFANKYHIARAALEATAFQTQEVLAAMEKDAGIKINSLKVDGGMVHNNLLMQFQADILDAEVIKPVVSETTALGAAYAAGLAVNYWTDTSTLIENWKKEKSWKPNMEADVRSSYIHQWKKAVEKSMNWIEK